MVKLVEECSGTGDLLLKSQVLRQVRYQLKVFQGMAANGLPIPTRRSIEGSLDFGDPQASGDLVGAELILKLEDGRKIGIKIADADGGICERTHGGGACSCC